MMGSRHLEERGGIPKVLEERAIRVVYDGIRSGDWQLGVYEGCEADPLYVFLRYQGSFGPHDWHEIDGGGENRSFEEACIELAKLALLAEEATKARLDLSSGPITLPARLAKALGALADLLTDEAQR